MLTLYTLTSASEAMTYYSQGDYYTQQSTEGYSVWLGKGAEKLGLDGSVDFKVFEALLSGHLPNGERMTQVQRGQYHRPGYDLTFSAPKSLSILALVLGNETLLKVHREAVLETLEKIENKYAGCRKKDQGIVNIERTANITVAAFEHSDSREGDPNLHTHCVLMNVTQDADGQWRALYADELYPDKLLNGMEYRSRLAHKLMALGFEIELKENGLFEIKGMPQDLIELFSKRRVQIKSWLAEHDQEGGKAAEAANFLTREAKDSVDPEQQHQRWIEELNILGSGLDKLQAIVDKAKEQGPISVPDPSVVAEQAISSALSHLSERQSTFSFQEVIRTAKLISLLPTNEGDLLNTIEQKIANNTLIYLKNKLLTTIEAKNLEQNNIALMQAGKNAVDKISAPWIARFTTAFRTADVKERKALIALLTSNDRQLLLSSNSKVMLNQTLKDYIAISSAQKFYPRVLTQNKSSVETLKKHLETERVSTIEGFLLASEERAAKRGEPQNRLEAWNRRVRKQIARDIWVVNGDISVGQLNRLGHFAETLGARIVLTQLKKFAALESLKNEGIHEIKVNTSKQSLHNLQSQQSLLGIVHELEKNNALIAHQDYEQRQKVAVEHTLNADSDRQLITLSHAERIMLNNLVRQQLKQTGELAGPTQVLDMLQPLGMSREEKAQAHLYQPGDVIRFNRDAANCQILKDSYFTVHKVSLEEGLLELYQGGTQVFWNPAQNKAFLKHVEVFKKEQRELQTGDILIWSRTVKDETNQALDRIKGQKVVVSAINQTGVAVKYPNDCEVILNPSTLKEQHWDYGYSVHLRDVELSSNKALVVALQAKQLDHKAIQLLGEMFTTAREENIQTTVICNDSNELKKVIAAGSVPQWDNPTEVPYQRAEALENYQTLATQPLFNRLQSETLKISQRNPEFNAGNSPVNDVHITAEFRTACDIVDKVCIHHAEREAVLNLKQLKEDVVQVGALLTPIKELESAIDCAIKQGWLISVGENEQGEQRVTTKHTLLIEQLCIEKMKAGQGQLTAILDKNSTQILDIQNHSRLTQGQKQAVELILTTQDRMIAVQGIAGAGKTTALKEIKRLCQMSHYTLVLANTASAKNQAKSASGIEAKTTAQFLTRMETAIAKDLAQAKKDFGGNRLFILDESSLASSKDLLRLQTIIEKLEARLALVGDFKQQGSIGAGFIFHDLLAYGIATAVMQENVRLSDPTAFAAMKEAYAGDMAGSLQTLKDCIEEIPNKQEALERIVTVYFALTVGNKNPLVIIPLNEDRKFVNNAIRSELKKQGKLPKAGQFFRGKAYEDCAMTISVFVQDPERREVDKSDVFSYQASDIIRFNTNHPRLNLQAGDYAHILDIDLKHQRLTLKVEGKEAFYWSPKNLDKPSSIEIYQQEQREFAQNDVIVFKRNNEAKGIFNGDKATILKIEKGIAELLLSNGSTLSLDLTQDQNQHLDHGYALTIYAAQGKDVQEVIAYGEGPKPYWIKASQLKMGDVTVLDKKHLPKGEHSKVVQVIKTETSGSKVEFNGQFYKTNQIKLTLKDRDGGIYTAYAHELKSMKKVNRLLRRHCDDRWAYFPPFESRSPNHLPLATSQQGFIIQITRGNWLLLIVPNVDDYQKTLRAHQQLKRSALSYIDPEWQKLHQGVKRLVANIKGKAEEKVSAKHSLESTTTSFNSTHQEPLKGQQPKEKNKAFMPRMKNDFIDKDAINHHLEKDILGYASQWLGSPKKISGVEARWPGALTVNIKGPKAGMWKRWSTGEGGKDLISLYMAAFGVEWKVAIQELAKSLGVREQDPVVRKLAFKEDSQSPQTNYPEKIAKAVRLYHKGIPIAGTLAEKYLRKHRRINGELPTDFRFVKSTWHLDTKEYPPALLAPIRDKDSQVIGVVRIFLNKDGSKYSKTYRDECGNLEKATPKANLGLSSHGAVTVQQGTIPTTLWVAEGIETALSIAKARPNDTVMASLSVNQLKNIPVGPEVQKVIICADNDGSSSNSQAALEKAIQHHLAVGRQVFITMPEGKEKCDFNDLLKQGGLEVVKQALSNLQEIKAATEIKAVLLKAVENPSKKILVKQPERIML